MSSELPKSHALDEMVSKNIWYDRKELAPLIDQILGLSEEGNPWTWVLNSSCKYISIRIDMRDGGFILTNRDKDRIDLGQLKWQYSDSGNEPLRNLPGLITDL